MLEKREAIETLGEFSLLLPAQTTAALTANDRLKFYFTVLQAAVQHAQAPGSPTADLGRERAAAGIRDTWPEEMAVGAVRVGGEFELPQLARLKRALAEDLAIMAKPILAGEPEGPAARRAKALEDWLAGLPASRLRAEDIERIVGAAGNGPDTVHQLVLDLHKAINALAVATAAERIDGAHVWNLAPTDRARVAAFMQGLNRTAWAKFDHPGLATAATRAGERLLIQNDIGVNAAHVLVVAVEGLRVSVTYSDLREARFAFFRELLAAQGARWDVVEPHNQDGLNQGRIYWVGTATFDAADEAALDDILRFIGSKVVFLIDWNRARKKLRAFVDNERSAGVLAQLARRELGHMAWLRLGGEQLLYRAMLAAGDGAFRLGDTLQGVLGGPVAESFLAEALALAAEGLRDGRAPMQVEDEIRLLLGRRLQDRSIEFDLAEEHAGYCHEIALAVRDALAHAQDFDRDAPARAKAWEAQADELVTQARELAERHPHRRAFAGLVLHADDVADALEEAMFVMELLAENVSQELRAQVRTILLPLADTALEGVRDYVRALTIARALHSSAPLEDSQEFLEVTWRMMHAERRGDEQLRAARRQLVAQIAQPAALNLATDIANQLEVATDHLMVAAYALRDLVLSRAAAP